ncbi:LacI family DNA-binding transcriptional regulator [Kaustia mangrovi]|uniref:LacI family DNA-binding transcriptional regulator n=1 Tax=Kaustia mangrovi TaxID=2593653 RepID=A0A7S8C3S8_9HYPH|nr:LacI family DNA-binding transcriptional regulator [Kaustia mangrovi]QPC42813.1 LacI family DNA-binding transcriptional regulator [Kaustia mangrovi]
MATITEIARLARVSTATVSHVLNRTKPVSAKTRRIVEEIARELGYSPSRSARSLKTGRSATIGLIAPDLTNPFFPAIAQAVEAKARELGHGLIIVDCHNDPDEEQAAFALVGEYRVDGAIWIPVREDLERIRLPAPVVTLDRPIEGIDGVTAAHREGGRMVGREIAARGHGSVGILRGPAAHYSARERYEGLREGLGDAVPIGWTVEVPFSLDLGEEAEAAILDRPVSCIACANDQVAIRTLQLLARAGRAVPDEVSVIGFDDIAWSHFIHPPLTTVRQPYRALGTAAVELLFRRIAEPDAPRELKALPVTWIERESLRAI